MPEYREFVYSSELTTVNQLLFAATLFRDSSVVNWITASNFRNGAVFISKVLYAIFGLRRLGSHEIFSHVNKSWFTVSQRLPLFLAHLSCAVVLQTSSFSRYVCYPSIGYRYGFSEFLTDHYEIAGSGYQHRNSPREFFPFSRISVHKSVSIENARHLVCYGVSYFLKQNLMPDLSKSSNKAESSTERNPHGQILKYWS
jgi:hypothetical protein